MLAFSVHLVLTGHAYHLERETAGMWRIHDAEGKVQRIPIAALESVVAEFAPALGFDFVLALLRAGVPLLLLDEEGRPLGQLEPLVPPAKATLWRRQLPYVRTAAATEQALGWVAFAKT